jgi:hypothetical protein
MTSRKPGAARQRARAHGRRPLRTFLHPRPDHEAESEPRVETGAVYQAPRLGRNQSFRAPNLVQTNITPLRRQIGADDPYRFEVTGAAVRRHRATHGFSPGQPEPPTGRSEDVGRRHGVRSAAGARALVLLRLLQAEPKQSHREHRCGGGHRPRRSHPRSRHPGGTRQGHRHRPDRPRLRHGGLQGLEQGHPPPRDRG